MTFHTFRLILEALGILGAATLVFIAGHKLASRAHRYDYINGWDAGTAAERERWEEATGTTWDALAGWNASRSPAPDSGEWEAWLETGEPPSTEVLFAEADERLGKPSPIQASGRTPTAEELDAMVTEWERCTGATYDRLPTILAAEPGPPIVADLTGAAAWHYPGEDDVPTLAGVVLAGPPQIARTGPEWLETQLAAMDSETAAYLRRVEAEVASFRRGIGTGTVSRNGS